MFHATSFFCKIKRLAWILSTLYRLFIKLGYILNWLFSLVVLPRLILVRIIGLIEKMDEPTPLSMCVSTNNNVKFDLYLEFSRKTPVSSVSKLYEQAVYSSMVV